MPNIKSKNGKTPVNDKFQIIFDKLFHGKTNWNIRFVLIYDELISKYWSPAKSNAYVITMDKTSS